MLIPTALAISLTLGGIGRLGAQDADARARRPNILLLTVDTLRADHLGCYGYPDEITPAIDSLAERGTLFEDAVTTIGKTGPAFVSLFTSHFPPTTGARRNGLRCRPDLPLLTQVLKRQGYATCAIISNWTLRDNLSGLGRGFDRYDVDFTEVRAGPIAKERLAPDVTKRAVEWLEEHREGPVFMWVHYSDPHSPYSFRKKFSVQVTGGEKGSRRWEKRRGYASEVRFTDHWIQVFLDQGLPLLPAGDTYIVFLSDHGESLGEHDYWGHGKNVLQPNLRIPLILVGPGIPKGKRLKHPVSMVDILPTVLSFSGALRLRGIKGASLNRIWDRPVELDRARYAFADRGVAFTSHAPKRYRKPLSMCLIRNNWKAVYSFKYDYCRYFDLTSDPGELRAMRSKPEDRGGIFAKALNSWYGDLAKYTSKSADLSNLTQEDMAQLKSLGY